LKFRKNQKRHRSVYKGGLYVSYITKATDTDFCAIYEDMQQQFPYVEIKAKETFLTFLCATDYHIWLAKDDQRKDPKRRVYACLA
jgi:hypothetical protein